jgi:hypothetical protein
MSPRPLRKIGVHSIPAALLLLFLWVSPAQLAAQMTITGTVTDDLGQPVSQAQVLIGSLRLATTTGEDGTYQLFVPASRVDAGTTAQLTARRIGLRAQTVTVALASGISLTQDFVLESDPFMLEAVIVTGQGLREQRAKIGATINTIRAEEISESEETNLVAALAGKAPNVEVTSSTGDHCDRWCRGHERVEHHRGTHLGHRVRQPAHRPQPRRHREHRDPEGRGGVRAVRLARVERRGHHHDQVGPA